MHQKTRQKRMLPRSRRRRRGATMMEFMVVAPTFMLVIVYCGEFARMSMMRNVAQNAAYEACRYVITDGATVADGIDRAELILSRLGTSGAIITINDSDGTVGNSGEVENEIDFNTTAVTCSIRIPLEDNSWLVPDAFLNGAAIQASMTLRTERYKGYYDGGAN